MYLYKYYDKIRLVYRYTVRRRTKMADFNYEIVKNYGSLSESSKGWKKEIKLISWNQKEAKYDIREWSPDGEKMGKGVTLSKEEIINLKKLLNAMDDLD